MKGRSEWDCLTETLKTLAAIYGTTFPFPEGATLGRMNDAETAEAAGGVASAAKRIQARPG